ncbi:MAG TPA: hypothetical protein VGD67_18180 [Pseudonocardiaceae bacterium]
MRRMIALLALVVVAAGCAREHTAAEPPVPDADMQRLLAAWDADAVAAPRFVPIEELTLGVPSWDHTVDRLPLSMGRVVLVPGATLPPGPATGVLLWAGGATTEAPLLGARQALDALREVRGGCDGCPDAPDSLRLTGAELIDVQVRTDRGPAMVPAWAFGLEGSAMRIARVAVEPSGPAALPVRPPVVGSVTVGPDDRTLTVAFAGAAEGDGACTADYTPRVAESPHAVVLTLDTEGRTFAPDVACLDRPYERTATVTLAGPVGDRVVLDAVGAVPVPVERR